MTSIGYGPPLRIDGPPPIAPVYGLLSAADAPAAGVRVVPDADSAGIERWINGVSVYPYPSTTGGTWDTCAPASEQDPKDDGEDTEFETPEFAAFTAYVSVTCPSYKVWDQDEYKSRAIAVFSAIESSIVAHEFMSGAKMGSNPHLSDGNGDFPNGDTAVGVTRGIALLEQAIAETGRLGIIHVSPQLLSAFNEPWAFDQKTGVIRTLNGVPVIPDFGYAVGSTPIGHAAAGSTQEWAYATGPVDVRRSETFVLPDNVSEALDRGPDIGSSTMGKANRITYRVERYYLIDWDTALQAAVLIDACKVGC